MSKKDQNKREARLAAQVEMIREYCRLTHEDVDAPLPWKHAYQNYELLLEVIDAAQKKLARVEEWRDKWNAECSDRRISQLLNEFDKAIAEPSEQVAPAICKHQHVSIHHFCIDCRTHIVASENPAYRPPVAPPVSSATRERMKDSLRQALRNYHRWLDNPSHDNTEAASAALDEFVEAIIEAVGGTK